MTGEPGKPEKPVSKVKSDDAATVAKRTTADAEAALRQFELDQQRQADQENHDAIAAKPLDPTTGEGVGRKRRSRRFVLRKPINVWMSLLLGVVTVLFCGGLWWFLTFGEASEDRRINANLLPSPVETFGKFKTLWFDLSLTRNALVSIRRVSLGFALAALVGVPLGVAAGCFAFVRALLTPLVIFGRNIPIAALIPLTFVFFGIDEQQKVMFIFIACVAFVVADATTAVSNVSQKYVDTAYTLGASRWQTIVKVLFPLALPNIFNSLRLLFGLAFGYIMLAESTKKGDGYGGLGNMIYVSQHKSQTEHIYLILLLIPVIALAMDRTFYWVQTQLFPYRYGSLGIFNSLLKFILGLWDDLKTKIFRPSPPFDQLAAKLVQSEGDRE